MLVRVIPLIGDYVARRAIPQNHESTRTKPARLAEALRHLTLLSARTTMTLRSTGP